MNSSIKNDVYFDKIALSVIKKTGLTPVPLYKLQRVFSGAAETRFVNVGMRNGMLGNSPEAYRMLTGLNAHLAITRTDARTHIKGHAFAQGMFGNGITSLGFTDSGKIWSSNKSSGVAELVAQFKNLGEKIRGNGSFTSNSELDELSAGTVLSEIPDDIVAVSWHERIYQRDEKLHDHLLIDWEVSVDRDSKTETQIPINLSDGEASYQLRFCLESPHFRSISENGLQIDNGESLIDLLNTYPLKFYTATQSLIIGSQIFHLQTDLPPIDLDKIEVCDWQFVNIRREVESGTNLAVGTIHKYVCDRLCESKPDVLFYDHGAGEIADFISMYRDEEMVRIALYHVKASSKDRPGSRVTDVYDVTGQAVKSVQWLKRQIFFKRLKTRLSLNYNKLLTGSLERFIGELEEHPLPVAFEIVLVQPGISKIHLSPNIKEVLAATEDYIRRVGDASFRVWSAR